MPPEFWASLMALCYREVYGCLKHPYSGTAFRKSGSTSTSQMGVQPRFDLGFRNGGVLPAQLELGKLKKDLSELWTRPQISEPTNATTIQKPQKSLKRRHRLI